MRINLLKSVGCALLVVSILSSCGAKKAKEAEKIEVTKEEAFESVTNYPIPTSFEVIQLINKAGASYIISICNPFENANKYFTERDKALNLGVYGADLAYATTYQMKQETMNYLNVSKKLVDELNISTGFNRQLAKSVESNIDNKDSLILIITNSYYDTYRSLVKNGKDNQSLMVIAGSWIEGLYISSQIAISSRDNADFVSIMANQKAALGTIMELLKARGENDAEMAEIITLLTPMVEVYSTVDGNTLNDEQFKGIVENIAKVRNSIVGA